MSECKSVRREAERDCEWEALRDASACGTWPPESGFRSVRATLQRFFFSTSCPSRRIETKTKKKKLQKNDDHHYCSIDMTSATRRRSTA